MREDEIGSTDAVGTTSGTGHGWGAKMSTGDGFFPVDLVGKGDEVANVVDSSLIGIKVERSPIW